METQTKLSKRQQQFMEESDFPLPTLVIDYLNGEVEHPVYEDETKGLKHFYRKRFDMKIYNNSKYFLRIHSVQLIIPPHYMEKEKHSEILQGVEIPESSILPHSEWCSKAHPTLWMRQKYHFYLTALNGHVARLSFRIYYYHPLSNQLLFVNIEKEWK